MGNVFREAAAMRSMDLSDDAGLLAAAKYALAHDDDPAHAFQVCRLAVRLFEHTTAAHGLSSHDKRILAAAALLHDLGWTTRPEAHQKGSRDIILQASLPGFDEETIKMIALVARYHGKTYPANTHKIYRDLSETAQAEVKKLAAILRIADGLDRTHAGTVKSLEARLKADVLTIAVRQEPRSAIDIMGANRKKGLFEDLFKVKVVIQD